jgi:hypothetical protein
MCSTEPSNLPEEQKPHDKKGNDELKSMKQMMVMSKIKGILKTK